MHPEIPKMTVTDRRGNPVKPREEPDPIYAVLGSPGSMRIKDQEVVQTTLNPLPTTGQVHFADALGTVKSLHGTEAAARKAAKGARVVLLRHEIPVGKNVFQTDTDNPAMHKRLAHNRQAEAEFRLQMHRKQFGL